MVETIKTRYQINKQIFENTSYSIDEFIKDGMIRIIKETPIELLKKYFLIDIKNLLDIDKNFYSLKETDILEINIETINPVHLLQYLLNDYEVNDDSGNDEIKFRLCGTHQQYSAEELYERFLNYMNNENQY
jgi:hypothetical protein